MIRTVPNDRDVFVERARALIPALHLAAAREFLPKFGCAAHCGFGRHEPAALAGVLADHVAAMKIVKASKTA